MMADKNISFYELILFNLKKGAGKAKALNIAYHQIRRKRSQRRISLRKRQASVICLF